MSKRSVDEPLARAAIPWDPLPYQMKVAEYMLEHPATAVLLEPGMRKTSISLAVIDALIKTKRGNCAIVIAPRRVVHDVWPVEVKKWKEFSHLRVAICHGAKKDQAVREKADLYVMTFEGLSWFVQDGHLHRIKPKILVIDELAKYRHTGSARHAALKPYISMFGYRYGLTGSFAANHLLDVFGQMLVIDGGRTFGTVFSRFRSKYFHSTGHEGYTWVPKHRSEKEIHEALKDVAISLKAEDYIKIPKIINNDIPYDLPEKARKHYDEMEEQLLTYLAEERVVAVNKAVSGQKCRQIVSGAVYIEEPVKQGEQRKRNIAWVHETKFEILDELLEELNGKPLMVVYEFEHEFRRAQERYKGLEHIAGGVTDKQCSDIVSRWNRGLINHLWIQPQSAAHGLNMQEMNPEDLFGFTFPWDYELYDQVIRRIRRSGNNASHIRVHRPVARNTVEERVLRVLGVKGATQDRLVNALKFLAAERGVRSQPSAGRSKK